MRLWKSTFLLFLFAPVGGVASSQFLDRQQPVNNEDK
jgi:hypothetical protein